MLAMIFRRPGALLAPEAVAIPTPGPGEVLIKVCACAVCRTDLHVVDGELPNPKLPLIPGHQVVGRIEEIGPEISSSFVIHHSSFAVGDRVGIPWLGWTDGECAYCRSGRENLCVNGRFTGKDIDGGYAEYAVADERYILDLPESMSDLEVAPLLCGGLIGYRALRLAGDGERLGLYGFGSSAHIICQVAVHQGRRVFAFTRADDT